MLKLSFFTIGSYVVNVVRMCATIQGVILMTPLSAMHG